LGQTNNSSGNSGAPNSGNVTAQAGQLIISIASVDNNRSFTPGTGFTEREEVATKAATEEQVVSSAGTYAGTWTLGSSDLWACGVATFKPYRRVIITQ
jgi:hypothetical protein